MAGFEQMLIVGNLGADPELRYTQQGRAVCNFNVAVNRKWRDGDTGEQREQTKWFRIAAWGDLGERCKQYLAKGSQVMVVGTVSTSAYTTNQGALAASLEVNALNVQFLGSRDQAQYDQFEAPTGEGTDIPF